jgi:hypothetical protein
MGNELAEIEGHVDARIGSSQRLAIEIDAERAMQFRAVPAGAQRIRCHEHRRKGARRLGLEKAKALCQLARDEVAQRDIIGEADEPDCCARAVQRNALWHVARYNHDFGFHVAAPAFIGERNGIARPEEAIRSALIHQGVVPEAVRHIRRARLPDQCDMIHIGRAIRPLIGAGQWGHGFTLMEAHHRNGFMRKVSRQVAQGRFDSVPLVERELEGRGDMASISIPGEIIRDDDKAAIPARFQRSKFHDDSP